MPPEFARKWVTVPPEFARKWVTEMSQWERNVITLGSQFPSDYPYASLSSIIPPIIAGHRPAGSAGLIIF